MTKAQKRLRGGTARSSESESQSRRDWIEEAVRILTDGVKRPNCADAEAKFLAFVEEYAAVKSRTPQRTRRSELARLVGTIASDANSVRNRLEHLRTSATDLKSKMDRFRDVFISEYDNSPDSAQLRSAERRAIVFLDRSADLLHDLAALEEYCRLLRPRIGTNRDAFELYLEAEVVNGTPRYFLAQNMAVLLLYFQPGRITAENEQPFARLCKCALGVLVGTVEEYAMRREIIEVAAIFRRIDEESGNTKRRNAPSKSR